MLKILFTAAALLAVYFIFFKKKKVSGTKEKSAEDMVECSKCGVFTSVEDAYIKDGKYYCSKECQK